MVLRVNLAVILHSLAQYNLQHVLQTTTHFSRKIQTTLLSMHDIQPVFGVSLKLDITMKQWHCWIVEKGAALNIS